MRTKPCDTGGMVKRRTFFTGLGAAASANAAPAPATGAPRSTSGLPPRKVIVGTVMQAFWVQHPGLDKRLDQLAAIVDRMAQESKSRYGRGLDLAILPEAAITGEAGGDALSRAVAFKGPAGDTFARKAREHRSYIVVPAYLREANDPKRCSNAAVLVDRAGEVAGTYRKVHLVVSGDGKSMEGGSTPGKELPVFDCDFGKLAIQICYDMEFDRGWQELARKGAELVAWPTQSPQTAQPAARAMEQRCHIVSSTWRHNASVLEPTGKIVAQITKEQVLVQELDLSYAILPWSSKLRNGKTLQEKYGEKIGFRYYEDEDLGIFWSNDPKTPVRQMVQSLGLIEAEEQLARVRESYRKAGVLDY
ncbi:MAG: carbon-nitrogen hydrolase family protein [Bryobacteraceae bacterium]